MQVRAVITSKPWSLHCIEYLNLYHITIVHELDDSLFPTPKFQLGIRMEKSSRKPLRIIRCRQSNHRFPIFFSSIIARYKGAPARESRTGTRLVSPATGCQKKKKTPFSIITLPMRFSTYSLLVARKSQKKKKGTTAEVTLPYLEPSVT